jgi:hypothetical protein
MMTAAHAAIDIVYVVAAVTVDASRLPPVDVVSTSTYKEPIDWGSGDLDGDGENDGVPDVVGETDGVAAFDGDGDPDFDCVFVGVPLNDDPAEGVPEFDGGGDGVADSEPTLEGPGEVVLDGDVEGETVGETVLEADAPPLRLGVVVEAGVKEGEFVCADVGSPDGDTVGVPVGDEPTDIVRVGLGERDVDGVVDRDGVTDCVAGDGEIEGVPVVVLLDDRVPDGDRVGVVVRAGVPLSDEPADGVPEFDGVGLGDAATTPTR